MMSFEQRVRYAASESAVVVALRDAVKDCMLLVVARKSPDRTSVSRDATSPAG